MNLLNSLFYMIIKNKSHINITSRMIDNSFFEQTLMKKTIPALLIAVALIFSSHQINGQSAAACINNVRPICPNPAFTFTSVSGTGLTGGLGTSNPSPNPFLGSGCNITNNGGCQFFNAVNPEWLMLNITSSGTLGFVFGASGSANPQSTFLHWNLWKYSPATCANIFNNTQAPVSCNFNSNSNGGTGMGCPTPGGVQGNFQPGIPVIAGEQYLLLVSNAGAPSATRTISFANNGTAGLTCNPITVPNATACPNECTVVTASWSGAATASYVVLGGPLGPTPSQTSPDFTVCSSSTRVYTVLANGTNGLGQPINATQQFTLTVIPTASLSVSHATNYCYGTCASFTMNAASGGTYNFSGPGIAPAVNGYTSNPISYCNLQSPNNNGVFTFSANFSTGCSGSFTTQVNVAPDNFITINIAGLPSSTIDVCQGSNVVFSASMPTATNYAVVSPTNAVGFSTVAPQNGALVNFVIPNVQPSFFPPGTNSVILTVTSNINYNGILCPRQATLLVRMVPTFPIDVSPGTYTFCQGTAACITASAVNTTSNSFSWIGPGCSPGGFSSVIQNPCITNSMIACNAGNYQVTALFTNGFQTCPRTANVVIQMVAVNPVSALVPTLICQYNTANMCISAPNGNGSSVVYYEWRGPASFSSTSSCTNIPNIQPTSSGVYTAYAVYAIGTRTCGAFGYNQISVIPVPSVAVNGPTITVCRPDNVTLYSNAITAVSYSWAGPNSYTAGTSNTTLYYPPVSASGVYTVYVSYSNGGLGCFNTNTVNVSINPVFNFSLPSFIRGCPTETITINGPVGATSYSWTSSTGFSSTSPSLVLPNVQPQQSGIYALNASLGPCGTTRSVEIDILSAIKFTLEPMGRTVCLGDTVILQVGATGGSQNYAYDWTPSTYLSAPTGSFVVGTMFGTSVYNVIARDIACPNYTIPPKTFQVTVKDPPLPNLQIPTYEGCQPLTIPFDTKTAATASITTFDFGGFKQFQGVDGAFTYTFLDPGTYYVRIISAGNNGCTGIFDLPDPIVVHPKFAADIQWKPDVPTTSDNFVTFTGVSKYGTAAVYNWMFTGTSLGDNDTSLVKNPQRKFNEPGKFPVLLVATTEFGCVDTSVVYIDIRDDLNVYIPNTFTPNDDGLNDVFFVKGLGFKPDNFYMEIFDRKGISVFSTTDFTKSWDGTVKGGAPVQGTYIYKVRIVGANGEGRKEYVGHVTLIR
jgi:gliding motility-associated-like protein